MSIHHQMHGINKQKPPSSSFLGHHLTAMRAPLYVWGYTALSNPFCLLALRHKAILLFALTLHSCSVSMCVLRGRGVLMRQDYENQSPSPSRKAEAWPSAYRPVLIGLTHCDNDRIWYTKKDGAGHIATAPDSHTWHWPTVSVYVHAATCDATLGWQFCQCCSLLASWMTQHGSCGHSFP